MTGRERDATGLYYYRARYYDRRLHRFLTEDPAGLVGGLNRYAYVNGDPVNRRHPLQLFPFSYHRFITWGNSAARPKLRGRLPYLVAIVDFDKTEETAESAYRHAMCDGKAGQNPAEGAAATEAYIDRQMNTCTAEEEKSCGWTAAPLQPTTCTLILGSPSAWL